MPSEPIIQSTTKIIVDGEERYFRLTAPSSDAGTKLPLILAFHGGGDADEDFQQQDEFDELAHVTYHLPYSVHIADHIA